MKWDMRKRTKPEGGYSKWGTKCTELLRNSKSDV